MRTLTLIVLVLVVVSASQVFAGELNPEGKEILKRAQKIANDMKTEQVVNTNSQLILFKTGSTLTCGIKTLTDIIVINLDWKLKTATLNYYTLKNEFKSTIWVSLDSKNYSTKKIKIADYSAALKKVYHISNFMYSELFVGSLFAQAN